MNPVFWFELPADDTKKLAEFYKNAFGWNPNFLSPKAMDYTIVHTSETDEEGMPMKGNRINGGIFRLTEENHEYAGRPNIVIATDDMETSMEAIKKAGGKILKEPYEVPGYGMYAPFLDPAGNRGAIMKPQRA